MGQGDAVSPALTRRAFLAAPLALAGCEEGAEIPGGFAGASMERGHRLREALSSASPAVTHRVHTVIAGGGVAGLAAARALRQRGVQDIALLELEDQPGGNSRPGVLGGIACPQGAHYLPLPSDAAPEVQALLEELGLRRRVAGRWVYDERHLCHAPQERLWIEGQWQEGLLPLVGAGATRLAQYARFAREVAAAGREGAFRIPLRAPQRLKPWDGETFAAWLDARGLTDPHLRWYLDYCCRDDYGAGTATVSAAAGLHYFAARHGFRAPGFDMSTDYEGLLTWPEGNGWLTRALARPLGDRVHTGRIVTRIESQRHGVEVDAIDAATGRMARWQATQCIVALPAFIAARVVVNAPPPLVALARRVRHAPWLVVNLHLKAPPRDRVHAGMPLAWDNVLHGTTDALGYVVATHQSLNPAPGPTVLSWYLAPGEAARAEVLRQPWTHWRDRALTELAAAHPHIEDQVTQVQVARYGHAMPIPVPGLLSGLPPPPDSARLKFAHGDWSGYSIFEEAFARGHAAGGGVA